MVSGYLVNRIIQGYISYMRSFPAEFSLAIRDYLWLLDGGYPETASLALVGNRYALPREERNALFRGVASTVDSARRRSVLRPGAASAGGKLLLVDGYNQLFLIMHYLQGKEVFIASDGFLRDSGAAHGRVASEGLLERSVSILADAVAMVGPGRVRVILDSPVPRSAERAALIGERLAGKGLRAGAELARSADAPLRGAPPGAVVATGDSAILDALAARADGTLAVDLARFALEGAFGEGDWFDFGEIARNPAGF